LRRDLGGSLLPSWGGSRERSLHRNLCRNRPPPRLDLRHLGTHVEIGSAEGDGLAAGSTIRTEVIRSGLELVPRVNSPCEQASGGLEARVFSLDESTMNKVAFRGRAPAEGGLRSHRCGLESNSFYSGLAGPIPSWAVIPCKSKERFVVANLPPSPFAL